MINRCPYPTPTAGDVKSIEAVLYWVWKREAIRLARENGHEAPWTADPIFAKYRFCNIRRRDDRVTRWLMSELFQPYVSRGEGKDLWFLSCIARYVNWPPSLLVLLREGAIPNCAEEFDPGLFVRVMNQLKGTGAKCWGSAYMLYPGREKGSNKAETVARRFLLPLAIDAPKVRVAIASNRVEIVTEKLAEYYGWNTFLAGQVAADLTYYDDLKDAYDLYTWAPVGPGSQQGLNLLHMSPSTRGWKQAEFNSQLQDIYVAILEKLDITDLTLHDVQNCMCEYGKYARTVLGQGAPRSLYVTETAY